MKNIVKPLLLAALVALVLNACGKKAEEKLPENVPVPAPAPEAPTDGMKPSATNEPGGYAPTPEERVPGITRPTEAQPADAATTPPPAEPAPEAAPSN